MSPGSMCEIWTHGMAVNNQSIRNFRHQVFSQWWVCKNVQRTSTDGDQLLHSKEVQKGNQRWMEKGTSSMVGISCGEEPAIALRQQYEIAWALKLECGWKGHFMFFRTCQLWELGKGTWISLTAVSPQSIQKSLGDHASMAWLRSSQSISMYLLLLVVLKSLARWGTSCHSISDKVSVRTDIPMSGWWASCSGANEWTSRKKQILCSKTGWA